MVRKEYCGQKLGGVEDALQISQKKANVSRAALVTQYRFGEVHGAGLLAPPDAPPPDQPEALEEYFDALAAAASTEKEIL